MEAFLYTLDVALVIYLCGLVGRTDKTTADAKTRPRSGGLGPFAYKQDEGPR